MRTKEPQSDPLAGPRFPYRVNSPDELQAVNDKVAKLLAGVDDMLYGLVRRRQPSGTDEDWVQDMVQRTRIWLWRKSLPKFDNWRKPRVKESTFLNHCARMFISQELRTFKRRKTGKRTEVLMEQHRLDQVEDTKSHISDRKIEELAEEIMSNPEKFLTAAQVEVFKELMEKTEKGKMMKQLASVLQYRRASSLSMMYKRIKNRISEVDIEGHEPDEGEHRAKRSVNV